MNMHTIALALACFVCIGAGRRLQFASEPDSRHSPTALNSAASLLLALRSPAAGWQAAASGGRPVVGGPESMRRGSRSTVVMGRYKAPTKEEIQERTMKNIRKMHQKGGENFLLDRIKRIKDTEGGKTTPRYSVSPQVGRRPLKKSLEQMEEDQMSAEKEQDLFGSDQEWRARKSQQTWNEYQRKMEARARKDEREEPEQISDLAPVEKRGGEGQPKWDVEVDSKTLATFFDTRQDFTSIGASEELQAALESMDIHRPSRVQGAGFDPILKGEDVILADQTGSGKTIAYLAPIAQVLKRIEEEEGLTPRGHVRAVVLAPTSELAGQVLSVAKAISAGGVPFRSGIVTGEHDWSNQVSTLRKGLELLVCTPGRFRSHIEAGTLSLSQTHQVVLDEADLLFEDEDFPLTWEALRQHVSDNTATAFVTATLPEWLVSLVRKDLPLVKIRKGKNLHRTAAGVTETLIDCSGGRQLTYSGDEGFKLKTDALMRELAKHPADRVLIFCNTIESARKVENFMRRRDRRSRLYEVHAFHGAIATDKRKETMARFLAEDDEFGEVPRILVATDRASRGIDFRMVKHVILFDFPRDGVEYVRRVGRATRGTGAPGHITSLLLGRQVAYARALMKINREGRRVNLDVHGITAPISNLGSKDSERKRRE
mmetsp:Transcript_17760/g.31748  ORF Transcript_17760/g.31748 Transcript_17760/m.31748 type:complete len:657 (+) Transcript_17760:52-2022(+)